jgi:tetratricopeptide (TPR) repeat protein
MSDINLREYLNRLSRLSTEGTADEVLWHARHILQYFPKNVDAYRYVGKALTTLGRYNEASAALRRVLSVFPSDFVAHLYLSEVNQRTANIDQAIWHLERAFEQDPNNAQVLFDLQRLYREHRQVANPRIQLTTAAVARQNIRSGELDRAVETLRNALERSPSRSDLRLMLAEALWQRGETVGAAETAMDVLHALPNCLLANRMLAQLWLTEGRPSDAQPYLNRIEAVDPYLALELIQNREVDDNTFALPQLDYQRSAQAAMISSSHDWLEGFEAPPQSPSPAESPSSFTATMEQVFADLPEEMAAEAADDDWMAQLDAIDLNYTVNTGTLQATTSPLDVVPAQAATTQEEELPDFTALTEDEPLGFEWAETGSLSKQANAPLDWASPTDEADQQIVHVEADPLAWMRSSGIEIQDNPSPQAAIPDEEEVIEDQAEDPLGWLQNYHTEVIEEWTNEQAQASIPNPVAESPSIRDTEEVEPAEWDEELPFPEFDDIFDEPSTAVDERPAIPQTMPLPARFEVTEPFAEPLPDEADLNATLLDETLGLEDLIAPLEVTDATQEDLLDVFQPAYVSPLPKTAPLPPLTEDELAAMDAPVDTPTFSQPRWNTMPDDQTPNFDWMDETPQPESGEPASGATGMLDWLAQVEDGAEAADIAPMMPEGAVDATGSTGMLDWLAQSDNPAYDVPAPAPNAEDPGSGSTGMLNWLSQNRPLPPTTVFAAEEQEPQATDVTPEWLFELEDSPTDAQSPATEVAPEVFAGSGATEMLNWIETAPEENVLPETAPLTAAMDAPSPEEAWLEGLYNAATGELDPQTLEPVWDEELVQAADTVMETDVLADDNELADWLQASSEQITTPDVLPLADEFVADEAPAAAEVPVEDWLAAALPEVALETPQDMDVVEQAEPWLAPTQLEPLTDLELATAEADVETWLAAQSEESAAEIDEELPWLAATAPTPPSPEGDVEAWLEASNSETLAVEDEAESPWLAATVSEAPVSDEDLDAWAAATVPEPPTWGVAVEDASAELDADAEAWFATVEETPAEDLPPADIEEPATIEDEGDHWFETAAPIAAVGAVVTAAVVGQRNENEPDTATVDEEALAEVLLDGGEAQALPEWMDDIAPQEEAVAVAEETPVMEAVTPDEETAFKETEDAFFTAYEEGAAPIDITAADNAPEWLNAMVPGLEIDYDAEEDAPLETAYLEPVAPPAAPGMPEDYGWLIDVVDEETKADQPAPAVATNAPRFIFSRPPIWLRNLLAARTSQNEDDNDLPSWLR